MVDVAFEILRAVGLEEKDAGFFAGQIAGHHVAMEYWESRNQIGVFWAAAELDDEAKRVLKERLRADPELFIRENNMRFDQFSVCVMVRVSEGLGQALLRVTKILEIWAEDFQVRSGCFVCGDNDGCVKADTIGDFRAMMCNACRDKLHDNMARALREESDSVKAAAQKSGRRRAFLRFRGIIAGLLIGALCTLPWFLVIPNLFLPFAWPVQLGMSALLFFAVYKIYRLAATEFKLFGFSATVSISILLLGVCVFFENYMLTSGRAAYGLEGTNLMVIISDILSARGIMTISVLPISIGLIFSMILVLRQER